MPIHRSQGSTASEKHLLGRCERSFLNYWSYANLFRNDHGPKELVDVLVCCGPYLILFSDKSCEFSSGKSADVGWPRWYKKAILTSKSQLLGAEKFINEHSNQIYLDSTLTSRLPLRIPPFDQRRTFLICVANGAGKACKEFFGSTRGSLVMTNNPNEDAPFSVGDLNTGKRYVHVLDDNTLDLVLSEFDTINDFAMYLSEKETLMRAPGLKAFHGEEEAVAVYLRGFDEVEQRFKLDHAIERAGIGSDYDMLHFEEGFWDAMQRHPQYVRRAHENRVSYLWDSLIHRFTDNMIQGTSVRHGDTPQEEHEGGIRYMALEPRTHRRLLSKQLLDAIESFPEMNFAARTILPDRVPNGTNSCYVFLQLSRDSTMNSDEYEEYRARRRNLLYAYCLTVRLKFPDPDRVIGIATEPPRIFSGKIMSEDMLLIDRKTLFDEEVQEAREILERFKFLDPSKTTSGRTSTKDFPDP